MPPTSATGADVQQPDRPTTMVTSLSLRFAQSRASSVGRPTAGDRAKEHSAKVASGAKVAEL
ncbi:MAG TPA: hypothetical protein VGL13_04615, partial [Polyangiaceae bacterium]